MYFTVKIPHGSQITRAKETNWKGIGEDISVLLAGEEGWLLLSMKNSVAEFRREFLKRLCISVCHCKVAAEKTGQLLKGFC